MAGKKAKAKARKATESSVKAPPKTSSSKQGIQLFERRPSPGMDQGLFAKYPIKAGTIVVKEKALFVVDKPSSDIYHEDVVIKYNALRHEDKCTFLRMPNCHPPGCPCKLGYFEANSFLLGPYRTGCFPLLSQVNHSCDPNIAMPTTRPNGEDVMEYVATRDIAAGEELCKTYLPSVVYMPTQDRATEFLRIPVWFEKCLCALCQKTPKRRLASDMRRTLIRGLFSLVHGRDVQGTIPGTVPGSSDCSGSCCKPEKIEFDKARNSYIFAMLCEAEGAIGAEYLWTAYNIAGQYVVQEAESQKLARLPPSTVKNIRDWAVRSKNILDWLHKGEFGRVNEWCKLCRFVQSVDRDGLIDWEGFETGLCPYGKH